MEGYTRLAEIFTRLPELSCFRKFDQLSWILLLFKQAELSWSEQELYSLWRRYPETRALQWCEIRSAEPNSNAGKVRAKINDLEKELRTFRHDLLETFQFQSLQPLSKQSQQSLTDWLGSETGGNCFAKGIEADPWDFELTKDVVCLSSQAEKLDRFFMRLLTPLWHSLVHRWKKPTLDVEKGLGKMWCYEQQHFVRIADAFAVLASALVPSASILALYFVHTMLERLILIVVFSLVFAGVVLFGFDCGRPNTFAATVAFAAAQTVFIQGVGNA